MSEDQSRSEFEAWLGREAYTVRSDSGKYESHHIDAMWSAWKASRRTYRASVLEEAAKVCDAQAAEHDRHHHEHAAMHAEGCADAIRALAVKTQEGQ